jgi:hypothetical protein
MPDIERNFQLRTLWVVTLCFAAARRHLCWGAAVGELCATTPLVALFGPRPLMAALFEASSPIHEDRNGLPQAIERMEVSHRRHLVDMLGCDLEHFCHVARAQNARFFFQLRYQTHICAPQQKTIPPLNVRAIFTI